ncbi:MAG TPA: WG repeat-containing protein [Cyclobacteriaceae bacterium]|nr:WG repeat-containing protein [Cyclobacteriaceae bacterium]
MKLLFTALAFFATSVAFSQDILIPVKKASKWGYVNTSEAYMIPSKFDNAWPFYNEKAVVIENKSFGLIDTKGNWIIKPKPGTAIGDLAGKRLVCTNETGKWGALDLKGNTVVPFTADAMSAFQYGMAITGTKTSSADLMRISVVDTLGKPVITFDNIYLPLKSFGAGKKVREGYVSVLVDGDHSKVLMPSGNKLDGRDLYYALLDIRNQRLVNLKITSLLEEVREGRFNMAIDGISYSWSLPLDSEPVVSQAKFSFMSPAIYPFSSGIAAIQKDGKWAFVDKDGSLLSETNLPVTDYVNEQPMYSGGLMIFIKKSGEGIYTDVNGVQRIEMEFDELHPFQLGAAVVKTKGKYGLIQKDGTWAVQPVYENLRY